MNTLSKLFRRKKEPLYSIEIHDRILPMYHELIEHFSPRKKNMGYIVTTTGDLERLITIPGVRAYSAQPEEMRDSYKDIKNKHLKTEPFEGVLYKWTEANFGVIAIDMRDKKEIQGITDKYSTILRMDELDKNPRYKALSRITLLVEYTEQLWQSRTDDTAEIKDLSLNQDVVDYIIKLQVIAKNNKLFKAFIKRDDEWMTQFFKPLQTITEHLGLLSPQEQPINDYLEQQLDDIVNWSSSKLEPYENPAETLEAISKRNILQNIQLPTSPSLAEEGTNS